MLLTPEEAGAILEKAADIQAWLADLEGLVSSTLLSGQPVTGWKMVEGRSKRPEFKPEEQLLVEFDK